MSMIFEKVSLDFILKKALFCVKLLAIGVDNMENISDTALKRSRIMYIFEAAFEYLISILVAGSFLATLTKELGFSDSLTGILSSIISLGCLFQLTAVFLNRKRLKSTIIILSIVNQVLFALLYVIPFLNFSKSTKTIIFVFAIITAYIIYNMVHPKKISWLMSVVDFEKRGGFTAKKEMISLVFGMIFSYIMGSVVDHFKAEGKIKTAFIICGFVIFTLMVLHTLTMLFTVEKQQIQKNKVPIIQTIKKVFNNKKILSVAALTVIYYISNYSITPFLGTYKINELGFSLQFVSLLTILSSASRFLVSIPWGKYADKTSFAKMIEKCFIFLAFSYLFIVFSSPTNGKIMLACFYIMHGISMGGLNSALMNLIFDYAPIEIRADSLAVCQAGAGVVGFFTTLLFSPVISAVQNNGNKIFGVQVYAQQILATVALLLSVFAVFYVRKFLIKKD